MSGSGSSQVGIYLEATTHIVHSPEPQLMGQCPGYSFPLSPDRLSYLGLLSLGGPLDRSCLSALPALPNFLPGLPRPGHQLTNNEALRVWKLLKELSEVFISLLVGGA